MRGAWKTLSLLILTICSFIYADVFMTELTDPQNSSDAGRYVELHNNGDAVVDLSSGWSIQRWTNGNVDPQSPVALTGAITPGGFYIICNDADKFAATYGGTCDLDIGTGGAADSNGDDNIALLGSDGSIVDMFGVPGEDGTGTGHEFEDGRAERAATNIVASSTWEESGWNIDNDSGGGDGNQYAPEGFDPGAWIGAGDAPDDVYGCTDIFGLNFNSDATADDGSCSYANHQVETGSMYYSPSDLVINMGESVQWNNVDGFHDAVANDGSFSFDACSGPCLIGSHTFETAGTFDYICSVGNHEAMGMVGTITVVDPTVNVTFSVDMSIEGVVGDVKVRTSTVNGDYSPSDWFVMDDSDGDLVYTYTMSLLPGVTYGYNFNNSDGSGYESGGDLGDCAGGNYGNDRFVTPNESDMVLDSVCWESCDSCPAVVEGCTDPTAENYNPDATVDDGSCEYAELESANLLITEAAEGSSNNKYIEVYNASDETVDLSSYAYPTVGNAPSEPGNYEYWNTFEEGASVASGDVYVICHGSSDDFILAECDETYTYMSNGDDGLCLVFGSEGNYEILDCVGDWNGDPGSGWDVAGVTAATKDHTLVRKSSISTGNDGDWTTSAGTNADDSEWVVLDQNTWDYLGSHPHEFAEAVLGCMDPNATNFNPDATEQDFNEFGTSTCTYASCLDIPTEMGCLWEDGTSAEWWEGWWNCTDAGGQVCGLHEVVFELNLPDGIGGIPHVNGSYNGWCGQCYNDMSDDDGDGTWTHVQYFGDGETHDYKFTTDGWGDQEDLSGLDCAVETDGYWNRQFTTGASNTSQTLTYCWGTCDETCDVPSACGDGTCDENEDCSSCPSDCGECPASNVTFGFDGLEDCGQVNITGTFDGWTGWGVNPADHPDYTISLADGDYEFVYLCVDTSNDGWWNDVWANSVKYDAPVDGDCWNGDYDYANYAFTVAGEDMTVSYCAGTCNETCELDACGECMAFCVDYVMENYGYNEDDAIYWCETTPDAGYGCGDSCGTLPPSENAVTFGFEGLDDCGQVNITGTFDNWSGWGVNPADHPDYTISLTDGDYEFLYLCVDTSNDGWWNDVWGNSTTVNPPADGDCSNGNPEYTNYVFTVAGEDMTVSYCAGTCDATCGSGFCQSGDSNLDGDLNVLDIVVAVEIVFGADYGSDALCATDTNADGSVDVLDIVLTVEMILGGRGVEADRAELNVNGSDVVFNANGSVGAFQIKIKHNNSFKLELTDDALVSDYRTTKNSTTIIIVAPETDFLFSTQDHYVIEEVLAATTNGYIDVEMELPLSYTISSAYPNPFNPSTTISIDLNTEANVSISVYNTMGQLMDVLVNDNLNAGSYPFVWNAQDAPSGLYFIKTNINSNMSTQKILLLK